MQYNYVYQYEICALIFLFIVTVRFFSLRRFPGLMTKVFGILLCICLVDISLDLIGSYTIEHANDLPNWVNYAVNIPFYSMQVLMPVFLMLYIIWLADLRFRTLPQLAVLLLPAMFFVALVIFDPITDGIFYISVVDGVRVYTRGLMFDSLYIGTFLYFIIDLVILFARKKHVRKIELKVIIGFMLINLLAMMLQYLMTDVLLTGVGIALAMVMMFLILENPESKIDYVTGVFNNSAMLMYLSNMIADKKKLFLVAIDLADVRRVNSNYDVWTGNEALHEVGAFLLKFGGKNTWIFKMTGPRVICITDNKNGYENIIRGVEKRFCDPWMTSKGQVYIKATIRYYANTNFFSSPQEVVNFIDLTYDSMDRSDYGTCRMIDSDILQKAKRFEDVEAALRSALTAKEEFYLNIQPIYNTETGRFASAEVLLRFNSKEFGMIPPNEFINVAERTGLIFDIDRMVVRKTCRFIQDHPELSEAGVKFLQINLSASEFAKNIYDEINAIVGEYDVDPRSICFEVTETAATSDPEILQEFMDAMISDGYRFALDDFGTGFANLMQTVSYPFELIKIDRDFLLSENSRSMTMFDDLLRMFPKMGLETITEGVETKEQAKRVIDLGGKYIQGYYYSKPLPEEEFVRFAAMH